MSSMNTPSATAPPSAIEKAFVTLLLLYSTAPFFPLLQGERDLQTTEWVGNFTTNLIWIMIYLGVLWFLLRYCPKPFAGLQKNWILLLIVGIGPVSLLWSQEPILTFLRSGAMFGTALISIYMSRRYTTRELLTFCCWAMGIAAVCSVFFVVFLPKYGLGTGSPRNGLGWYIWAEE